VSERPQLRPAVFIDRDGTISEEVGYLNHISRFSLLSSAPGAIRRLNERGIPAIVVTNQSGVGRGYFPESLVRDVHEAMTAQLAAAGARLDAIYYCPHVSSDLCACRKPSPGMLERAAGEHAIDLECSFVVGDRFGDIELGHRVGARSILVRTGYGEGEILYHLPKWKVRPDFIADDLAQATDWILEQLK
jgi:D-glycero-D-manno-heptose 1,7-bisphosphate phosphatase